MSACETDNLFVMFEFLYCQGKFYGFRVSEDSFELSFQQAPVLWSASQSLLQAVKTGPPGISWRGQIRTLRNEINALVNAISPNDQLARIVIGTIPKEASERGIFPEDALKERFAQVEKLARRVDLVPAKGGPLLIHILSYVQSLLLVKSSGRIPQAELNDEKVDYFNKLGTHDILFRAKFWLDRGDLVQALKYMNLLKGAARSVARQWMYEAKILLETRQAANILMAHAASCSLKYL